MNWFDDFPGVTGAEPLNQALLARWPDRAMEQRLRHLRFCPAVVGEIYQMVRHLPLTVIDQPAGRMVVFDLRADVLRRPAFGADGSFQRSFRPAVTRLLPFCTSGSGAMLRLCDTAGLAEPDRPQALQGQVLQMLQGQAAAIRSLSLAAEILVAEGLLAQVSTTGPESICEWRPAPAELGHEVARAAANLAAGPDTFLALRLLALLEFSDLHRQESRRGNADAESLRSLLGRNDALRRQVFLVDDEMLDFSGLAAPDPMIQNQGPEGDQGVAPPEG